MDYPREMPVPDPDTSTVLCLIQAVRTDDVAVLAHLIADPDLQLVPVLLASVKLMAEVFDEYHVPAEAALRWACIASARSTG